MSMMVFFKFLEKLKALGLEAFDRYYSVYPAIVTDNVDPEQRGRIKLKVPGIFGDEELHNWVLPISNPLAGAGSGAFFPPYIDDAVLVMFDHGDVDYPLYIGGFWGVDDLDASFKTEDYPNIRGWAFKSGQKLLINETEGKLQISILNASGGFFVIDDTEDNEGIYLTHKTGSVFQIQKNGSIVLATPGGNMVFLDEEEGAVTFKSKAGALLTLKEKLTLGDKTGKNIVSFTDNSVDIIASKNVNLNAVNVNLEAAAINLGKGASLHPVIYEAMKDIFDQHLHATPVGPSGPPLPPNTMALMEAIPPKSAKASAIQIKGNT